MKMVPSRKPLQWPGGDEAGIENVRNADIIFCPRERSASPTLEISFGRFLKATRREECPSRHVLLLSNDAAPKKECKKEVSFTPEISLVSKSRSGPSSSPFAVVVAVRAWKRLNEWRRVVTAFCLAPWNTFVSRPDAGWFWIPLGCSRAYITCTPRITFLSFSFSLLFHSLSSLSLSLSLWLLLSILHHQTVVPRLSFDEGEQTLSLCFFLSSWYSARQDSAWRAAERRSLLTKHSLIYYAY